MEKRFAGLANQSAFLALNTSGLDPTGFVVSYTRYVNGDGTSIATVNAAVVDFGVPDDPDAVHSDNAGTYLNTPAGGSANGSEFLFRVDLPDAAWATGALS